MEKHNGHPPAVVIKKSFEYSSNDHTNNATLTLLPTRVAVPMKKTACLPPTPKYEMSLFRDRGAATDDDDDEDIDATLGEFSRLSRPTLNSHQQTLASRTISAISSNHLV